MQENERNSAPDVKEQASAAVPKRSGKAKASARFAFNVCVRTFFWFTLALTVLFFAAIAATRFWIVPNADDYRPRIVEELSKLTKQRVAMGGFTAVWNGWSPEFRVSRLQILDDRGRTLLELPEVETTLSWRSLFFFEPRLSALTVKNPRVVIRRTSENQLTFAGIDVDLADTTPSDPAALEWLLRQRFVQIENGEFEWHDEWRKLPPLRLRSVNVRLANDGAHHRFGMTATPNAEIASPLQFRSEFVGSDVRKISDWDGSAYVRVDYANVALLARYLPLPIEIARGDGGIQVWFDFEDGRATSVTTDLVVRDARMAIPVSVPGKDANTTTTTKEPIALNALSGRLSWRENAMPTGSTLAGRVRPEKDAAFQQRWSLRDVALTTSKGEALPPISAELKLERNGDVVRGGEFRAAKIDLATTAQLSEVFAAVVPSPWLNQLREASPRGLVSDASANWGYRDNGELRYEANAKLETIEWKRGALPGVTGLSGKLKLSEYDGSFAFESAIPGAVASVAKGVVRAKEGPKNAKAATPAPPVVIDFGAVFRDPLVIGSVGGSLDWKLLGAAVSASANTVAKRAVWQVRTDGISVSNEDLQGKFSGTWQSDELGPGVAKISGKLDRASTVSVHKYLPTHVDEDARNWIKNAVLDGKATNVAFALEGALWHFPFENGKQGKFEIVAPVAGLVLDYADGWPRAEAVEATLTFRGSAMNAQVTKATIAGAAISATQVQIDDMGSANAAVEIKGNAASGIETFLKFVETSPVNRMLDRFTEGAKGSGSSRLNLSLVIPFDKPENTKIDGEFVFEGNRVELTGDIPPLEQVSGRLRFSEKEVSAKDLRAVAFGGSTSISVATEQGVVKAGASGRADLARVREKFDYPLLDQLNGSLDWKMDMQTALARDANTTPTVRVSGVLSPQTLPFDRVYQTASTPRDMTQPVAFNVVRTALAQGRDRIEFELPGQLHAILERSAEKPREARVVERAVVDFGAVKTALPLRGYSLRGELAKLDTDAALALLPALTGRNSKNVGGVKSEPTTPDFINVNLKVDRAYVFSQVLTDVNLRAQPSGQRWRLALRSKEAIGLVSVDNDANSGDIDAVSVRLQRLVLPTPMTDADRLLPAAAPMNAKASDDANSRWPKLDLVADSFVSDGRELGKLEIAAQPSANEWRIDRVKLASADGSLNAKGRWRLPQGTPLSGNGLTSVEVSLDWVDAGRFMQRFGMPKGVERGEGELKGEISWAGSPAQFAYTKLDGKFSLSTKAGRFTEMEPGIAKLLGVISLQSLPRRLSFKFDDLFGSGFAFDSINAEVNIEKGKASTEGFDIVGPAARVEIRGLADLDAETTKLRVRVFPSVSVATAIGVGLATANPAIGAAAWLGQKIARDPVERLLMQEFDVSGSWSNPDVKQTRGLGTTVNEENVFDSTGQSIAQPPTARQPRN
jgi:uncharacterized protein YhdP